ncbi:MAG: hypothetical protein JNL80_14175 [Phycisphaerae bacterium]|nr:hypothetical protein [Phycisphaerae bacterium]
MPAEPARENHVSTLRHYPFRMWAAAGVLALGGLVVTPANCQTLDLDAAPPLPRLRGESVTLSVTTVLKEEIEELERPLEGVKDPLALAIRSARLEMRRLAFHLLAKASSGSGPSDLLALHGFRIADVRRRVDVRLERVLEGSGLTPAGEIRPLSVREKDRVLRLLVRFSERAPKAFATAALEDLVQLDAAVAVALQSLIDALAIMEERGSGDDLGSGWPTADELVANGGIARPLPISGSDTDPCDPALRAGVGPATQAALDSLCGGASGSAVGDLSGRHDEILAAARLSRAAASATWLDTNERAALDQRAAALANAADGPGGSAVLVGAQAGLIAARNRLALAEGSRPSDLKALDAAVRWALFPSIERGVALSDSPEELARILSRITESVGLGAIARVDEAREPAKELRTAIRDAERRYAKAEAATWTRLERMLKDEDALTNPEHTGLVREQREALRDIDRILGSQALIDSIGGVRPQAARGLSVRMKSIIRWLGEPSRRNDAILTFDTLAQHVRLFLPMPFERDLREHTDEALAFTAGKADELIQLIELSRAQWADAWATSNATGPESRRMVLLHRLLRTMADLSQSGGPGDRDSVAALSRWGGFHATKAALAPALVDVAALTQIATSAALAGDDAKLARDLDRIERDAPLTRLVGRLSRDLDAWLATRPIEVLGQLVAVREPPPEGAWGLRLRARIAAILRTARELDFARRAGRSEDEKILMEHLSRLAQGTLDAMGAERSPLPSLPQLDESEAPAQRGRKRPS